MARVPGSGDGELVEALLRLELALARRDRDGLEDGYRGVLDPGFLEIGASGRRWGLEETVRQLEAEAPDPTIMIESFELAALGPDAVLATYRLTDHRRAHGPSLRSSVWLRRDGRWRLRFHQGTRSA